MIDDIKQDARERMEKCIEALGHSFNRIRTGRAHPSLLDSIKVDYYGSESPIPQVANVSVEDARTLSVTPWDKSMVSPIEKAILTSDLGLNPSTAGQVIRIPLPPLTEERRRELGKVVHHEGENAKIAIRNIRRDANASIKELLREKEISEDDERKAEHDIQQVTDLAVKKVDEIVAEKEQEILEI